jgi:hypothetical protein
MKRITLAIFALGLLVSPAFALDEAEEMRVRAAVDFIDRAGLKSDAVKISLARTTVEMQKLKEWSDSEIRKRDARIQEVESSPGYRAWEWLKKAALWVVGGLISAYAAVFVFRALGLGPAAGALGGIFSIVGTAIGGILPGGGYIQAAADNYYFRAVKPAREEYHELKTRARLAGRT